MAFIVAFLHLDKYNKTITYKGISSENNRFDNLSKLFYLLTLYFILLY